MKTRMLYRRKYEHAQEIIAQNLFAVITYNKRDSKMFRTSLTL